MRQFSIPFAALGFALTISSCGPSVVSLPVVGKLSNGETAQGSVLLDLSTKRGEFDMVTLSGLSCEGTYNTSLAVSTITIPVACNNGSKGRVIATRDASGVAGTAIGRLSNGMTGRFLFGNVSAQMQADFLNE
ncbi:hypothetical protein [Roseovarius indicus]|uniref:Lipoprotein n=1 Tax=Roseovarius indicus TaxID=540747 RepID=A0A0T5P3K2_9RHOB|nr:hypothetical protein [Roseovarius indicus]KRS15654.1 hypothetical protein XM52_22710 [Roseovarius indicus]